MLRGMSWLLLSCLIGLNTTSNVYAQQDNIKAAESGFQWDVILGMSVVHDPSFLIEYEPEDLEDYLELGILFDVSYKRFYIRTAQRRSSPDSIELGFLLYERDNWAIDLLARNYLDGFDPEDIRKYQDKKVPKFETLNERLSSIGIALRYSYFFENAVFNFDIANIHYDESLERDAWVVDSFYSHLVPYRNWDIYFGAGLRYLSEDAVNYFVGVSEDEASPILPAYQTGDGFKAELEVHAQYPLSQNWSFNLGVTQSYLSKNISRSPIGIRSLTTKANIGVRYVF